MTGYFWKSEKRGYHLFTALTEVGYMDLLDEWLFMSTNIIKAYGGIRNPFFSFVHLSQANAQKIKKKHKEFLSPFFPQFQRVFCWLLWEVF